MVAVVRKTELGQTAPSYHLGVVCSKAGMLSCYAMPAWYSSVV